ncbi:MAG: hypothetical protein RLZZ293_441 [Pseudomonadota bacterium]|jgi:hypothetical protein
MAKTYLNYLQLHKVINKENLDEFRQNHYWNSSRI